MEYSLRLLSLTEIFIAAAVSTLQGHLRETNDLTRDGYNLCAIFYYRKKRKKYVTLYLYPVSTTVYRSIYKILF